MHSCLRETIEEIVERRQKEASEERKCSQETAVKERASKEVKPKTCFRCGSPEHMLSKCPTKKRSRSKVEAPPTGDSQAPRQWGQSVQQSKGNGKGSGKNMHSQTLVGKGGKGRYGSERPSKQ